MVPVRTGVVSAAVRSLTRPRLESGAGAARSASGSRTGNRTAVLVHAGVGNRPRRRRCRCGPGPSRTSDLDGQHDIGESFVQGTDPAGQQVLGDGRDAATRSPGPSAATTAATPSIMASAAVSTRRPRAAIRRPAGVNRCLPGHAAPA